MTTPVDSSPRSREPASRAALPHPTSGASRGANRALAPERVLLERLRDQRSRKVIFLSHCLLNENTRYLGGACHGGCIPEIVQQCIASDLGIVQLPCPEQRAWGGVLKRRLLFAYGLREQHPRLYRLRRLLLPLAILYTRHVYRQIAADVARQIADYNDSGFVVRAVVGVDGSPSCGVNTALDTRNIDALLALPAEALNVCQFNGWVSGQARSGTGLFVAALQKQLKRRRLTVPFLAHDLLEELDGQPTTVNLEGAR